MKCDLHVSDRRWVFLSCYGRRRGCTVASHHFCTQEGLSTFRPSFAITPLPNFHAENSLTIIDEEVIHAGSIPSQRREEQATHTHLLEVPTYAPNITLTCVRDVIETHITSHCRLASRSEHLRSQISYTAYW